MKLRFWKKNQGWQELSDVTFSVPPGSYKATTTIRYDKGNIGTTTVVVPTVEVKKKAEL